jgi:flagellin-specific chaperone FliS
MKANPDFTQMLYDMIMNKIKEAKNASDKKTQLDESEE